jgi:hypothetical protein
MGGRTMEYRAVANRCAVDLEALRLPLTREEILSVLERKGFRVIFPDLIALARGCIGKSEYRRGSRLFEAPRNFDCSSFIKWLYSQAGICLPRRSIQQRDIGEAVAKEDINALDAVFVSGHIDYFHDDPADGVGHVGLATGKGTVIHAANRKLGVIESSLADFIGKDEFRGARRYLPQDRDIVCFETPAEREVESSDDFRWIVLQSLPKK